MRWLLFSLCVFVYLIVGINGQLVVDERGKLGPRTLTIKTPELTEEENYSHFLPEALKCDACRAVAYQLHTRFEEFNAKNTQYKGQLPESELIPLMEGICHPATFEHYGLKDVDGIHKLTGEGLEAEEEPGVVSSGGLWPIRLVEVCSSFVDELGEEAIYSMYLFKRKSITSLENSLCYSKGLLGACNHHRKNGKETDFKPSRSEL